MKNENIIASNPTPAELQPMFFNDCEIGNAGNDISGAQSDRDVNEDDEGQGAGILSFKSHVKLTPVELSNITSPGKLRSRHPTSCLYACMLKSFKSTSQSSKTFVITPPPRNIDPNCVAHIIACLLVTNICFCIPAIYVFNELQQEGLGAATF